MDRDTRRTRVTDYVRARLMAETAKSRGAATKIAKATGFADAHVANVKNGKAGVGDDFARAIAKHWSMTLAELEAEAMKRPEPPVRDVYPNRAIVMRQPEYTSASSDVREAFVALRGREGGGDKSVVEWSLDLNRLIEWDRMGLLETRGGVAKPIK